MIFFLYQTRIIHSKVRTPLFCAYAPFVHEAPGLQRYCGGVCKEKGQEKGHCIRQSNVCILASKVLLMFFLTFGKHFLLGCLILLKF